jgi:hypothetical protein
VDRQHPEIYSVKYAVYSAGPSLNDISERDIAIHVDAYQLRIGLNAAINKLPDGFLHWYAAGDHAAYSQQYTVRRPSVGWCCIGEDDRKEILAPCTGWGDLRILTWDNLSSLRGVSSPSYSITAAISLAHHLGADDVDVFFHDAAIGKPNANAIGSDNYPKTRSEKEAQEISDLLRVIEPLGTHVEFKTITRSNDHG